jgi:hypothetical protein
MRDEPDRLDPSRVDPRATQSPQSVDRSQEMERPVSDREVVRPRSDSQLADAAVTDRGALFEPAVLNEFNVRWSEVQTGFVDEPRRAVQQADALVSDIIKRIADSFSGERAQLEQQWDRGGDVSTEELRQALQRYRSLFSRLLTL